MRETANICAKRFGHNVEVPPGFDGRGLDPVLPPPDFAAQVRSQPVEGLTELGVHGRKSRRAPVTLSTSLRGYVKTTPTGPLQKLVFSVPRYKIRACRSLISAWSASMAGSRSVAGRGSGSKCPKASAPRTSVALSRGPPV